METETISFDRLGSFYLGRKHDLAHGQTHAEPLLYDSKDLTTHAVCVGMTGSGKTGLCLSLLEEAALDGVPAIAIDPKGDLGNLLLAFPNLAPADFRPWIDESEAARKQMSPDEFAASQAGLWRGGLAQWGQGPDRVRRYVESTERVIYTPGSSAGIPIKALKSFRAPPAELLLDSEALGERIASAVSGLLALVGIDADPVRSREHIFLSNVFDAEWRAGHDLELPQLIRQILQPTITRIGVVDLESFYPAAERTKLSMKLNNLLASPSFASWLEGQPLDIGNILYTPEGKPRLAVMSIAHLDDAQRMFFVTILLSEILAWIRTQPGTSSLRALLYMDEVFGYFPPVGEPPSKRPMLTLLKQARAYGLGCVLATQNPVDLDYKGLSNAGTWFLGRLQTERDKARVIEGLEGASAQAGGRFNRQQMEATLAGLGSRVFLMNNVHDNEPVVFQTRWAMSYLRGPLTRDQIKTLMDPVRAAHMPLPSGGGDGKAASATAGQGTPGTKSADRLARAVASNRPILSPQIRELFLPVNERVPDGYRLEYRAALSAGGKVHFVQNSHHVDQWRDRFLLQPIHDTPPDDVWDGAFVFPQPLVVDDRPDDRGQFADLPAELAREKNYPIFERQLAEHLYRTESLNLWTSAALDECSRPGETPERFRARLGPSAATRRDQERAELESEHLAKLAKIEAGIKKHQTNLSTQKWQFFAKLGSILWAIAETVLRVMGQGRRGRPRSPEVAFRQAAKERGDQSTAQVNLDQAIQEKNRLAQDYEQELQQLDATYAAANLSLELVELKPRKADIETNRVMLVWLPWRIDADGRAAPVYQTPGNVTDDSNLDPYATRTF
jgi:hypothetical protein